MRIYVESAMSRNQDYGTSNATMTFRKVDIIYEILVNLDRLLTFNQAILPYPSRDTTSFQRL